MFLEAGRHCERNLLSEKHDGNLSTFPKSKTVLVKNKDNYTFRVQDVTLKGAILRVQDVMLKGAILRVQDVMLKGAILSEKIIIYYYYKMKSMYRILWFKVHLNPNLFLLE